MTNFEKYKDKIVKMSIDRDLKISCCISDVINGTDNVCGYDRSCSNCTKISINWLFAEYVKPETDWSRVSRGTKVFVWDYNDKAPLLRKFFAYDPSFTAPFLAVNKDGNGVSAWKYCELAEENDNE